MIPAPASPSITSNPALLVFSIIVVKMAVTALTNVFWVVISFRSCNMLFGLLFLVLPKFYFYFTLLKYFQGIISSKGLTIIWWFYSTLWWFLGSLFGLKVLCKDTCNFLCDRSCCQLRNRLFHGRLTGLERNSYLIFDDLSTQRMELCCPKATDKVLRVHTFMPETAKEGWKYLLCNCCITESGFKILENSTPSFLYCCKHTHI